jgi:hypothetical protein
MKTLSIFLLIVGLLLFSCTTSEPVVQPDPVPETVENPPESSPEEDIQEEPEVIEEAVSEESDQFEVSQEVYEQTFEEIEALIQELSDVISRNQYDKWLTYLSTDYIRTYNSQEQLDLINEYPQLKDNGVVLKNLKDYFSWVVVPSRSRAVLGDIVFVGETEVIAYSSFEGKRAKLYELEQLDGEWKITVW